MKQMGVNVGPRLIAHDVATRGSRLIALACFVRRRARLLIDRQQPWRSGYKRSYRLFCDTTGINNAAI